MMTKHLVKVNKYQSINISNITLGEVKSGRKVRILYGDNNLVFETCYLEIGNEIKNIGKIYHLETYFTGSPQKELDSYFQFIEDLETHLCNLITHHDDKLFTEKNVIIKSLIKENQNYFTKWIVEPKDNLIVDTNNKPFNISKLKVGDQVKFIVEIPYVWIHENQFGLANLAKKIKVKVSNLAANNEYIFNDSDNEGSSEDDNKLISLLATEQKKPDSEDLNIFDMGGDSSGVDDLDFD
jgi:hypothetical protein